MSKEIQKKIKKLEKDLETEVDTYSSKVRALQEKCKHKWIFYSSTGSGTEYQCEWCGDWK